MKTVLTDRLIGCPGVRAVSANTLTGTILVLFPTDWNSTRILTLIETALEQTGTPRDIDSGDAGPPAASAPPWHQMPAEAVLKSLKSDATRGLTPSGALACLQATGPNVLETLKTRRRTEIFIGQFLSMPSLLLAASAALSLATGAWIEAAILSTVTLANAAFGYFLEHRTEKFIAGLKRSVHPTVQVIRDAIPEEIPAETLVIGDLLILRPGTYIGADSRIIAAVNLKIDESILTGESEPVEKRAAALPPRDIPVTGRLNMAFMGTLVVGGEGLAVVVTTGKQTEFGRIQDLMQETLPPVTPQVIRLQQLSNQLLAIGALVGGFTLGLAILRGFGPLRALSLGLSMTASTIPAGLPSVANLSLALNMVRLKKNHLAIQRLYAFETLGEISLICFDKTGTLTRGRISVLEIYCGSYLTTVENRRLVFEGRGVDPEEFGELKQLLELCILCNENKIEFSPDGGKYILHGSPTEKALLHLGILSGLDVTGIYAAYRLESVQHRSQQARYMVTLHTGPKNQRLLSIKGNPSEVLSLCRRRMLGGRISKLSPKDVADIETENERMASNGLRVLGFAYREPANPQDQLAHDLVWVGLVGMMEPIRMGVPEMIAGLHAAGIETVMITGDQSLTAYAIASRIDIAHGRVPKMLDSSSVSRMKPELMEALVKDVHVYSRVNPEQKLQIVRAYQQTGEVVAMTGDGINDGPALQAADIGIAMGLSGTEVAREISDIILERDNITALEKAVKESRTAGDNIKRSIRHLLTVNFSDVLVNWGVLLWPSGSALIHLQPSRINIFLDIVPSLALLNSSPDADVMKKGPRDRHQPFFTRVDFGELLADAALLGTGALGAFTYGVARYGWSAKTATIGWESLAAAKLLHAIGGQSGHLRRDPADGPSNRLLPWALGLTFSVQALPFLFPAFGRLLGLSELKAVDFCAVGAAALFPLGIRRLQKRSQRQAASRFDSPASMTLAQGGSL